MSGARVGVLALVVLAFASQAAAQVGQTGSFNESRTRSFLEPDALNREACEEPDGTATLTLSGQAPVGARFVGIVLEGMGGSGQRPQCFSYTTALQQPDARRIFTEELGSVATNFTQEIDVPLTDLMGDACTVEGGQRSGDRALCVYMVNTTERAIANIGFFLAVDTAVPPMPEIRNLRPGNGRALFTIGNVDDRSPDVYEFLVQHRRCAGSEDGGVEEGLEDAGTSPPMDAGTGLDAGLDGGLELDAGLELDGGEEEDVGEPNAEEAADLSAKSTCGATDDFTQTIVRTEDVSLSDLENGVQYELRVAVRDDFGNVSPFSEMRTVTPAAGSGPLDFYDGAGTPWSMAPSCGSTEGGGSLLGLGVLGVLALPLARRRRKRAGRSSLLGLALLPALLTALPSQAQDIVPESTVRAPRNGEVTLSIFGGPYRPAIDSERVNGEGVFPIYGCFFDDALLAELGVSFDWHLLDVFGSLQLGFGVNATQAKGFTLAAGASASDGCAQRTSDSVELTIVKLKPQLVYRFDPLLDWFGFPLVPYGRVGVVGAFYAFTENGVFPEPASEAQNPLGLVLGWEAAAGLMFALDFWDYLDPFSKWGTLRARANQVFNHAFIFGEASWQPVDNFGRPSLRLSPTDPFTGSGAPWTVHFGVAVELL